MICPRCESSWVGVRTGLTHRYPTRLCAGCTEPSTDVLMWEMARAKERGRDILAAFAERAAEYPWDAVAAYFEQWQRDIDARDDACIDARLASIQADYQAGKRIRTRRRAREAWTP